MDEELKKNLKRLGFETETRLTRSLLRWKYRREGRGIPAEQELDEQSRRVAETAHGKLGRAGKSVWRELKRVYSPDKSDEERSRK